MTSGPPRQRGRGLPPALEGAPMPGSFAAGETAAKNRVCLDGFRPSPASQHGGQGHGPAADLRPARWY